MEVIGSAAPKASTADPIRPPVVIPWAGKVVDTADTRPKAAQKESIPLKAADRMIFFKDASENPCVRDVKSATDSVE